MLLKNLPAIDFVAADRSVTRLSLADEGETIARQAAAFSARLAPGAVIGLALRSEPTLVLAWLAALAAGLRPLIMQYPTVKQTRQYWRDSVGHTIAATGCGAIVGDARVAAMLDGIDVAVIDPAERGAAAAPVTALPAFTILQLSSGTTGHRKAVAFTEDQLERHVAGYNAALALDPAADRIISWLPLYHDMGFIACFVMPLMLGVPVTMIDPETWVADRTMLFDAIEASRATICYMPNFGFEVLAQPTARDLSSMRLWVSCSEPVVGATVRRFCAAHDLPHDRFAACYAMAENVFAVSLGRGLTERTIDGVAVVSCGPPIPGVEAKIVDGEIWVKSPASIDRYLDGDDIRDADGFYPTGDVGALIDGAIYVSGRRRDVLIQAGKKFVLSNVDAAVNALLPEAKGRVAAVTLRDERLGTEKPAVLIEAIDFYARGDHAEVQAAVQAQTGLDFLEVHFVPPRFLTKTSSGKINRVISARDWLDRAAATAPAAGDPLAELDATFARMPQDVAVGEALDSLSQTLLRIILADAGVDFDAGETLAGYRARLAAATPADAADAADAAGADVRPFRIVSLADRRAMRGLDEASVAKLAEAIGRPVSWEHLCLPPSPVLLSDLVFYDWFRFRLPDPAAIGAVARAMERLKAADLIVVDDAAEIHFPLTQTYPVLSHRLERAPEADLIAVRWQRYAQRHHELPVVAVDGGTLPVKDRAATLAALSDYLGTPLFRIASVRTFADYTADWDYRPLTSESGGPGLQRLETASLVAALTEKARAVADAAGIPRAAPGVARFDQSDLAHFCAHPIGREKVDWLVAQYDRFCIAGQPASVPYVRAAIAAAGKHSVTVPSYDPAVLATAEPFDCLISCGPTGKLAIDRPAAAVMAAGWGANSRRLARAVSTFRGALPSAGAQEWYSPVATGEALPVEEIESVRQARRQSRAKRQLRIDKVAMTPEEEAAFLASWNPRSQRSEARRADRAAERAAQKMGRQQARLAERAAGRQAERRGAEPSEMAAEGE